MRLKIKVGSSYKWKRRWPIRHCWHITLIFIFLCQILQWNGGGEALLQITNIHQLYQTVPTKHNQLHYLNTKRLESPQLIFWNGIGATGETVFILATKEVIAKHKADFEKKGLKLTMKFNSVKITYEEPNENSWDDYDEPDITVDTSDEEAADQDKPQIFFDELDDLEERLNRGEVIDDQAETENLILKRRNRYNSGELLETVSVVPRTYGLLPVTPVKAANGRTIPLNSGVLYRLQGVQTLIQSNETTPEKGEWVFPNGDGKKVGHIPHVGEYFGVSITKKRSGTNPFITSEEDPKNWMNAEYRKNKTKSVLWMLVPTEFDKFYEIRNRNYPASLLVWNYDIEEAEFVLNLETRREYLKRYRPDGVLRSRALFSFQLISETYEWELRHDRPKFYLITYNSNHVYSYESSKKKCTLLVVRNSALHPYTPDKTDKFNRPLDMFYFTRLNLTGKYTASIFSFMYEKSIVDIFAKSAEDGNIKELSNFELSNRGPLKTSQFVNDAVTATNEYLFRFNDRFNLFQWVTIEAHVPSFGVAPIILTGAVGGNTNTKEIKRKFEKLYKVQDKVTLASGFGTNSSVIFQSVKGYSNNFIALMEVTEPADRLYWDRQGKPGFIRLSLPGSFIEKTWSSKANVTFDKVIERREAAIVVQIRGTMVGSYGLRAFVKKTKIPYSFGVAACEKGNRD